MPRYVALCRCLVASVVCLAALAPSIAFAAEYSELWGRRGEKWSPEGRLPDFSHAGYHRGEKPLPKTPPGVSVKQFGAVGDGKADDTEAFLKAIAEVKSGAIEVPPGRYKITKILEIKRGNLVLRGTSPEKSILFCPTPLQEIKPNWGATTTGLKTSNYSWSGGFVWIQGSYQQKTLAKVAAAARRGDRSLRLASTASIKPGSRVEITVSDTADNSLAASLYSGSPGDMSKLNGRTGASLVVEVTRVEGDRIDFDRPLRFDAELRWKPEVRSFSPSVTEVGVENLAFEFPNAPYKGHFTEMGANAVAIRGASDCWVRNIRIINADSGLSPGGCFCTVDGVVYESARPADRSGCTGHHGIYFSGNDNVLTNFDFRTRFIHDITVSHCAGNVVMRGRGVDLCFDHHKRAPYENLFAEIDAGQGTRVWRCGGGAALGKNCAGRGTFWNIRAQRPIAAYPDSFGPWSLNLVGLSTTAPSQKDPAGRWLEAIPPAALVPQNLYEAQLTRRLESRAK